MNRWGRTLVTNLMNYGSSDKTNTFGANAVIQLVPDKWTFTLNAVHQKVDGLMDLTTDPANSFWIARASVGGPADITDWDDTKLTTVNAQLDYAVAKSWLFSMGYMFEKYDFSDAFTSGTDLMPQSILIFLKPDNGAYKANIAYAKLNYRF